MPNPQLTKEQLAIANKLLNKFRAEIEVRSRGDKNLLFALRRKIYKELSYDERSKPRVRERLKVKKHSLQNGKCALCKTDTELKGSFLDRKKAINGYSMKNTRLLCPKCNTAVQVKRRYS